MKTKIMKILGILLVILALLALFSPKILKWMGLHPDFEGSQQYNLKGKRALVVTTSHGVLNKPGETTGKPTGG